LFVPKYQHYPTDHIMTKTTVWMIRRHGIELYAEVARRRLDGMENGEFIAAAQWLASNGREPGRGLLPPQRETG
jgi:hypothetical protein